MLAQSQRMIVIMSTGSGKSLVYLIPPLVTDKITVVLIPLRALLSETAVRIKQLLGSVTVWGTNPTRNPQVHRVLLASSDQIAMKSGLPEFLARLEYEQRLDRIILDECHVYVTADYRSNRLHHITRVCERQCPVVCLTATMPTETENNFRKLLALSPDNCITLRGSSLRRNLEYCIYNFDTCAAILDQIHCLDNRNSKTLLDKVTQGIINPRGIIYAITRDDVTQLGSMLKIPFYHSEAYNKEEDLVRFRKGDEDWIVGTSALGAGLDIPGVSVVILYGMPFDMLDFVQMAGRAGRNMDKGRVVILNPRKTPFSWLPISRSVQEGNPNSHSASTGLVSTTSCVQPRMSEFLDQPPDMRQCLELKSPLCWICQEERQVTSGDDSTQLGTNSVNKSKSWANSASRATVVETREIPDLGAFSHDLLLYHQSGCTFCLMKGYQDEEVRHEHQTCARWQANKISWGTFTAEYRRNIQFDPNTCCFSCAAPRWVCNMSQGHRKECTFKTTAWAMGFMLCSDEDLRKMWYPGEDTDPKVLWSGLGKAVSIGPMKCSRLWQSVLIYARQSGLLTKYLAGGYTFT